jgi:hypothetical protein
MLALVQLTPAAFTNWALLCAACSSIQATMPFAWCKSSCRTADGTHARIPPDCHLTWSAAAGVAARLGANLVAGFSWMGKVGPLFAIYLTTTILTALLSNGASVTIVYPIAKAMVATTGEHSRRTCHACHAHNQQ